MTRRVADARADRARALAAYTRRSVGDAEVVALHDEWPAVAQAIRAAGTLYAYAALQHASGQPASRELAGRAPAYAVALPPAEGGTGGTRVVVRHSRHGGLLAPVTGDLFLPPTRAPRELDAALRLARAGVPTPEVVAYAVYPAGPVLRRADVATREMADGADLAAVLVRGDERARRRALAATARLLRQLAHAGARHPDLNIKNVLVTNAPGNLRGASGRAATCEAYVLDVDRVLFGPPGDPGVAAANLARLARSARKWRALHGAPVDEADLAELARAAGAPPHAA